MPSPDIELTQVKGDMTFDMQSGFGAKELEAMFLGEKIKGSIASTVDYRGHETCRWTGRGELPLMPCIPGWIWIF